MRALLSLALSGAVALPGAALAQDVANHPQTPVAKPSAVVPALAPLPTVAPTVEAPPPVTAAPPPVADAARPTPPTEPTTAAPVLIPREEKAGVGDKVGTIAVGVAGGAAGAAVAGPVGKFAGGFLGKTLAKGLFGGKDKVPEVTVVEAPASAVTVSEPAAAQAPGVMLKPRE